MKSPEEPPTNLREQTLLKLAKMDPKQRTRLLKLEALRRGIKPIKPLNVDALSCK